MHQITCFAGLFVCFVCLFVYLYVCLFVCLFFKPCRNQNLDTSIYFLCIMNFAPHLQCVSISEYITESFVIHYGKSELGQSLTWGIHLMYLAFIGQQPGGQTKIWLLISATIDTDFRDQWNQIVKRISFLKGNSHTPNFLYSSCQRRKI